MSMDDTLPELIDVSVGSNDKTKTVSDGVNENGEDDFKQVMSKRKRRQEKMESVTVNDKKEEEDDDDEVDMEEMEEILADKPEEDQPLKKIKFPQVSGEKLMVNKLEKIIQ